MGEQAVHIDERERRRDGDDPLVNSTGGEPLELARAGLAGGDPGGSGERHDVRDRSGTTARLGDHDLLHRPGRTQQLADRMDAVHDAFVRPGTRLHAVTAGRRVAALRCVTAGRCIAAGRAGSAAGRALAAHVAGRSASAAYQTAPAAVVLDDDAGGGQPITDCVRRDEVLGRTRLRPQLQLAVDERRDALLERARPVEHLGDAEPEHVIAERHERFGELRDRTLRGLVTLRGRLQRPVGVGDELVEHGHGDGRVQVVIHRPP